MWDVRLGPVVGAEQGGIRPALVISSDAFNGIQGYLVFAVPVTGTDRGLAYQIRIKGTEAGLSKTSVLMCDQARSMSVQRFLVRRGDISAEVLAVVRQMVGRLIEASEGY